MTDESEWHGELAAARARWAALGTATSTTVWDLLLRDGDEARRHHWGARLAQMGILVVGTEKADPLEQPIEGCVRLAVRGHPDLLVVAVGDPWSDEVLQRLTLKLGRVPQLAAVSGSDLTGWMAGLADDGSASKLKPASTAKLESRSGEPDEVVHFVSTALELAVNQGSSDVHFETDRQGLSVKHRLDGVLRAGARIEPAQRAEEVISRIKVLAKLDITERRIPQDGRFRHVRPSGQGMDLRVSIMPSVHGEDAVLRLLDRAQLRNAEAAASLDGLQFDNVSVTLIRELAQLPHGMLLITGPTGSGKTTTVYGILSELNSGEEKIVTIEDPVEYELPGVLQIPVNERKGLTFAKGLRSILRHDPDRILVGEIRDAETAEIAVQSALTGHQVFTTVHANSLFDVTGRFRHFGLDMFGFVAALNGVVVQRLMRGLCQLCAGERPASPREQQWMASHGYADMECLPMACGCSGCNGTGYRRRFVLAEVHAVDDTLRDLITGQQAISALRAHVAASGVASLGRMAAIAVNERRTTVEEVRRVVGLA